MRISDLSSDVCTSDLERTSHGAYLFTLAIMNTAVQILIEHKRCPFRKASILVHYVEQKFPERGFGVQSLIIMGNQFRDSVFMVFGYDKIGRAHAELQSLMRISYAVFRLEKKKINQDTAE